MDDTVARNNSYINELRTERDMRVSELETSMSVALQRAEQASKEEIGRMDEHYGSLITEHQSRQMVSSSTTKQLIDCETNQLID